jgi:hypothetical protein
MKKNLVFGAILTAATVLGLSAHAESYSPKKLPSLRVIEDFSQYELDKFPKSFRTYPFQRGKAEQVYHVKDQGGNKVLHALDDKDLSVQAFKRFTWDVKQWPHFSWRWKAVTLPPNANENNGMPNDSACGIYVTFGGYTGNAIKYVWSTTQPTGTIIEKKPNKFYIVVLNSGSGEVGTWQTKSVNVLEDYKKIFKSDPKGDPDGFGLLTDGNATHSPAACDYDDFKISETAF